ncbi:HemK methyltransferase family member 2 [Myotis brandtii]|uniref:Methyltransferase HEMK2 n=1 Tax=Myotis brandtii TaxID=109478 RepID=S7PCV2_MYOBR|nr:HemK methyltransferase family member 2 [Myotis brandtii]
MRVELCLEVGSGSGVVSTLLASMIGSQALYMCTDINPKAAACTLETARCNRVHVHPVITDLVKGLLPRLKEKVDLLVFNPPYVVTPPEEVGSHGIEAAWAGGRNGREVMDRFFPLVPDLLSPRGLFYLVTIKENNPEDILEIMKSIDFLPERRGPPHGSMVEGSRSGQCLEVPAAWNVDVELSQTQHCADCASGDGGAVTWKWSVFANASRTEFPSGPGSLREH